MEIKFKQWTCSGIWKKYSNGRPALELIDALTGEPIAKGTVNLPDAECPDGHTFIKDYSENEGMLKALVDAGIVEDTGIREPTGHVEAALVKILRRA